MPPACQIDDVRRRVVLTSDQTTTGRQATDLILKLVHERPELMDYDWVHDIRITSGEVDTGDIDRVADAFSRASGVQTYTVFVTEDPNFAPWARTMDFLFRERKHMVAATPETAHALIDRVRASRSFMRSPLA